ncbi:Hypothetical protein CAP_5185 [Chondromyces apiculatus DSM 436]|uniref:Uncharacterized protein n=1 Tax=Chondromyces apiculatus DSM 436 TaxID=1192034 RepID=A0A017T4L4_9BACT|nr:Hypothetical protein CAP_5185 [Chondromyces apiculatus DSM 436]
MRRPGSSALPAKRSTPWGCRNIPPCARLGPCRSAAERRGRNRALRGGALIPFFPDVACLCVHLTARGPA